MATGASIVNPDDAVDTADIVDNAHTVHDGNNVDTVRSAGTGRSVGVANDAHGVDNAHIVCSDGNVGSAYNADTGRSASATGVNGNHHAGSAGDGGSDVAGDGGTVSHRRLRGVRSDVARGDWVTLTIAILSWVLYIAAAGLVSYTVYSVVHNWQLQTDVAKSVADELEKWPAEDKKEAYNRAKAYNKSLVGSGQKITGIAVNPDTGKMLEDEDTAYNDALNVNDSGAMAVLRIPRISLTETIRHGASNETLENSIGHIYGSLLPIGDPGLVAISAHSGGVNGMLFTRLPQLAVGDYMYVDTLGGELGYQIIAKDIVKPEDLNKVMDEYMKEALEKDEPMLMASTCYPIGINTDRLYVVAVQKSIPHPIPPSATQKDVTLQAIWIGIGLFIILIIMAIIWRVWKSHRRKQGKAHRRKH